MSSKSRNMIAWVLLLIAAVSWSVGRSFGKLYETAEPVPTEVWIEETVFPTTASDEADENADLPSAGPYHILNEIFPNLSNGTAKTWCLALAIMAALFAVIGIFFLPLHRPAFGPDGSLLILALITSSYDFPFCFLGGNTVAEVLLCMVGTFLVLICAREFWSWIRAKFAFSWYLENRMVKRIQKPRIALLSMGIWLVVLTGFATFQFFRPNLPASILTLGAVVMGCVCLWHYGSGLQHFKAQLNHFQQNTPIEVQQGAMESAERQLLDVQNQHREAVKAAVASERFKVDLISNVSHDLRTPLTAIVGYGELLQREKLSEEGSMQLARLNQKAGYMRELVESLFELTKVSSGVLECKKEELDLIRLLEQTIGLMDDQLSLAGLTVKRHYAAESIPIVTDGSRMHQVFANLLGNAIKYALPGTRIHLEVKDAGDSYRVRMVNTASYEMDFDAEDILQRFARGDKARSTQGSGLGLAIAQTYTESVGGKFRVAVDGDQFSAIVTLPKTERNL